MHSQTIHDFFNAGLRHFQPAPAFEQKVGITPLMLFETIFLDKILDFRYDAAIAYFSEQDLRSDNFTRWTFDGNEVLFESIKLQ